MDLTFATNLKTVRRNYRFHQETIDILEAAAAVSGTNENRMAEMGALLYAMEIAEDHGRAKKFFIDMLLARVAAHRMHPRPPIAVKRVVKARSIK